MRASNSALIAEQLTRPELKDASFRATLPDYTQYEYNSLKGRPLQ